VRWHQSNLSRVLFDIVISHWRPTSHQGRP
ncbi:hypothetical protein A2U01_0116545, partial [Trifolium medium]|nr:hypothetical protein [Trifolium medium]